MLKKILLISVITSTIILAQDINNILGEDINKTEQKKEIKKEMKKDKKSLSYGPFGLSVGMKIEEIDKKAKKIGINKYKIIPPKKHESFKEYRVWIDPLKGLYQIEATGNTIISKGQGTEIKNEFKKIYKTLKNKYGKDTYHINKKVNKVNEDSSFTSGLVRETESFKNLEPEYLNENKKRRKKSFCKMES